MSRTDNLHVRPARLGDVWTLTELIESSVRGLAKAECSAGQLNAVLRHAAGVDTRLIRDQTYFVVDDGRGGIVAAGGWSFRRSGETTESPAQREAEDELDVLNPLTEPARVRAFFVHPGYARRGLGRLLMNVCELEARRLGFRRLEAVATMAGRHLLLACGFTLLETIDHTLPDGTAMTGWRMDKEIAVRANARRYAKEEILQ